jgi:GT2 family glycosyltransferase
MFLRRKVVHAVGDFDETLGLCGQDVVIAAEETDYLIRALKEGFRVLYDPAIVIRHPNPLRNRRIDAHKRGYGYGYGKGIVMRKHDVPLISAVYQMIRPPGAALLAAGQGNRSLADFRWATFRGILDGYLKRPIRTSN